MLLTDAAEIAGARRTRDNYLVVSSRIARGGNIQVYSGKEAGDPSRDIVRVWRDPDVIFDSRTMAGWAFKPLTLSHPPQMVDSSNWTDFAVGMVGAEVIRDGEFVRVPMCLMDGTAIEAVENGTRELSCGYLADIAFEPGVTPDGEAYDARVTSVVPNHVAIVDRGRAGPEVRLGDASQRPAATFDRAAAERALAECRIGDAGADRSPTPHPTHNNGGRPMADADPRTVVVVDGLSVSTTPQGAEAIARLQRQLADAASAADARTAEHGREIQARDGQISALRQEQARLADAHRGEVDGLRATHQQALDALQAQVLALQAQVSDAALDARVEARAALISQARRVLGDEYAPAGRSDAQIRRDVVARALPAVSVADGASDDYIRALFDAAMASPPPASPAQPDPMRTAIMSGAGAAVNDAANAPSPYEQYVSHLRTAWQRTAAQGA